MGESTLFIEFMPGYLLDAMENYEARIEKLSYLINEVYLLYHF